MISCGENHFRDTQPCTETVTHKHNVNILILLLLQQMKCHRKCWGLLRPTTAGSNKDPIETKMAKNSFHFSVSWKWLCVFHFVYFALKPWRRTFDEKWAEKVHREKSILPEMSNRFCCSNISTLLCPNKQTHRAHYPTDECVSASTENFKMSQNESDFFFLGSSFNFHPFVDLSTPTNAIIVEWSTFSVWNTFTLLFDAHSFHFWLVQFNIVTISFYI